MTWMFVEAESVSSRMWPYRGLLVMDQYIYREHWYMAWVDLRKKKI